MITSDTKNLFPELAADLPRGAGLVAIPLGETAWLVFFRDELSRTIRWAGKPTDSKSLDSEGKLSPRASFAEWTETVAELSAPWDVSVATLITEIRSSISGLIQRRNHLLEESNKELRRFAAIVAHEVKNQISSGIMALYLLRNRFAKELLVDTHLAEVGRLGIQCLDGLATFSNEMITFARFENAAEDEEFELSELAEEIASVPKFHEDSDRVSIRIDALPRIRAARSQMRHLLINLVQNAIIHGKVPDRPISIVIGSSQIDGQPTSVFVSDDGYGIDPSEQGRIFDYFYSSPSREKTGSGIGLAFCSQIVQRSGNRIWVESEPNRGTTFHFTVNEA